jgi:hypothetical protein
MLLADLRETFRDVSVLSENSYILVVKHRSSSTRGLERKFAESGAGVSLELHSRIAVLVRAPTTDLRVARLVVRRSGLDQVDRRSKRLVDTNVTIVGKKHSRGYSRIPLLCGFRAEGGSTSTRSSFPVCTRLRTAFLAFLLGPFRRSSMRRRAG